VATGDFPVQQGLEDNDRAGDPDVLCSILSCTRCERIYSTIHTDA